MTYLIKRLNAASYGLSLETFQCLWGVQNGMLGDGLQQFVSGVVGKASRHLSSTVGVSSGHSVYHLARSL